MSNASSSSSEPSRYAKLSLHPAPSSLASLSRPSTPPGTPLPIPLSQPRFATIEQLERLEHGQANIVTQLAAIAGALQAKQAQSAAGSSDDETEAEKLETTVTIGAGHTPVARSLRGNKARRVSVEQQQQRGKRVIEAASSANRDVLGLTDERLRSTGAFLSSIADDMDDDDDEQDGDDDDERKVNAPHKHSDQAGIGSRKRVVVKRTDKRMTASSSSASPSAALHPDLFSPMYDQADTVVSLLSKSLSAGVKSKKKFADKKQLADLLVKGREHAIEADGLTEVLRGTHTAAWLEYESYLYKLVIEKGWEAADWYHRQLFERISVGRHELLHDGPDSNELIRELDRQYAWLPESALASRKAGTSSGDRFRSGKGNGGGGSNKSSGGSKASKPLAAFTGVPCKHHGPNSRHTTADCKDPKHAGSGGANNNG